MINFRALRSIDSVSFSSLSYRITTLMFLLFMASFSPAQICDSGATPCIDQLKVGDKKITGTLKLTAGAIAPGTAVDIQVTTVAPAKTTLVGSPEWNTDGTFSKDLATALTQGDTVLVTQIPAASGGTAKASALPSTCDKSKPPCIDQPHGGDTQITGKAAAGATVDVKVNGNSVGAATANAVGTFSKVDLSGPLNPYDKVQADQTSPGVPSGTGDVSVLANPSASTAEAGKNTLFTRSTLGVGMGAASEAHQVPDFFWTSTSPGPFSEGKKAGGSIQRPA